MRCLQVIAGLDSSDGGPANTLPSLWEHLHELGVSIKACSTHESDAQIFKPGRSIEFKSFSRQSPRFIRYSPELKSFLEKEIASTDVCHNHGCWLYPNWIAGDLARRSRKPLIISPLGHLDSWSLSRHSWRKKVVRFLFEEKNWRSASAFIAKSKMEEAELRKLGIKVPITVIPNGIDPANYTPERQSADCFFENHPALKSKRILLFLSRIHPKKGLKELLEQWTRLGRQKADWHLVIAGDIDNPYAREIRSHLDGDIVNSVSFIPEVHGQAKYSLLEAADLFVLPSFSENFGQVVLEALATGVPVITTHACPWEQLENKGCGWWISNNTDALGKCLSDALTMSGTNLKNMGETGRVWVLNEFSWSNIALRVKNLYSEVLGSVH